MIHSQVDAVCFSVHYCRRMSGPVVGAYSPPPFSHFGIMTNCARANYRPRKISVCKSALDVRRARLWGGRGSPACLVLRDPRPVAVLPLLP